jgi:ankyrin repeat protein
MKNSYKKVLYLFLMMIFSSPIFSQKIFNDIQNGKYDKVKSWMDKQDKINETYSKTSNERELVRKLNIIEWAAFYNETEIVKLCIENKAKFDFFEEWISTALGAGVHNCNIELTKILLDAGADPGITCQMCRDASLLSLALSYDCMENYELLKENGAPLISENPGYDVIHIAACNPDLNFLIDLVEKENVDVNEKGTHIAYPIFLAVDSGRVENIKYLVSKGAKLDVTDNLGHTILHYINDLPTLKFLEVLLSTTDVSFEKADKASPLIFSIIYSDNKELFDYFIANYSSFLNSRDKNGENAMFALLEIEKNTDYFFSILKKNNISFTQKNKFGKDLKHYAKKMKNKTLLHLIKENDN